MPKKVAESLPDEMRCRRTDGRKWRCTRRVVEGKKLCDIHYDQGRRRQLKQPVPDHLKLERQSKKIGKDGKKSKKKGSSKIAKRKVSLSETVEKAVRLVRLKRGDIRLELTREYLKMLVENKKKKKKEEEERKEKCNEDDDDELESTLVLPFGVMAISKRNSDNAGSSVGVDVKIEGASSSNSLDSMRTFRSKTIEPLPIGTLQVMPSVALMRKAKKCHWCRKNVSRNMIKCLKCRKLFFCWECIRQRQLERKEVKEECPVCLGICSCKICGKQKSEEMDPKEFKRDKSNVGNVDLLNYCIYMLFPVLKKINRDQRMELEKEATLTGKLPSRLDVQQLGLDDKHSCYCNNCKISILDYHRSCAKCSYNLCLNCCWELSRHNSKQKGSKSLKRDDEIPIKSAIKMQNWGACSDGSLVCPPVKLGGCGEGNLDLRCIFPLSWMKELEAGAAGLVQNYDFLDTRNFVCDCQSVLRRIDDKDGEVRQKHKVAKRVESSENIIYCVPLKPNKEELEHFQQHWAKGQPVIAQNVIQGESFLKWDPIQIFITHLEKKASKSQNKNAAKKENPDLDWYEVGCSSKQYYFSRDGADIDMAEQTVKIKSWLSPCLFEEQFPTLHAELMQSLPLQDYVNPISGFLNLALKLPAEEPTGPYIHIFSGVSEDFSRDEFLTKLCYDSNDVVNILAFATDEPMTTEQKKKIKTLVGLLKSQAHLQDTMGKGKASLGALARVPYITGNSVDEYIASAQKGCTVIDPEKTDSDSGYDSDMTMHITYTNIEPGSDDERMLTELARSFPSLETDVTKLCGAHWDIFRRQDAPKIMEYLRRHSHELWDEFGYSIHEVHPILDQTYYLDGFHKMRLKEEFGVQVWTFHQYPGEAIMIPAGCPYQMRRPRSCDSCLSVKIEFVSPESLAECIRLTDEIRHLPMDHKVRAKLSEVRKMAIHGTNSAIQELQDLMCKETDGMQGD